MSIRVRVLMLVTRLDIGGTEQYVLSLSKSIKKRGVTVGVASFGGPLSENFRKAGITVHRLPLGQPVSKQLKELSSIVSKEGYTLLHAHDSKSFGLVGAVRPPHRVRIFMTVHGKYDNLGAIRAAAGRAKAIICVSRGVLHWLSRQRLPKHKMMLVPNGIDTTIYRPDLSKRTALRKRLGIRPNAKLLLYAGRFSKSKWTIARKVAIASMQLARDDSRFVAILVGPGRNRARLAEYARKWNRILKRKAILVQAPTSPLSPYYNAADFVVGTGRVALEAMASGKPVIATGVSGFLGIIRPTNLNLAVSCNFGDHGNLSPLRPIQLRTSTFWLRSHPKISQRLGAFGRKVVADHFSIARISATIYRAYKNKTVER